MGKKAEIEKLSEVYDVMFLAETCLGSQQDFRIRGFDCLRVNSNLTNVRGMLVLIRNPIAYSSLDLSYIMDNSLEVLGVKLFFNNTQLCLLAAYRHPNVPTVANTFSSLTAFVKDHNPSILLGDFNAHHPMWGGKRINSAGRILSKFIDERPLIILNLSTSLTYISFSSFSSSTIDLALASPHVSSICEARVLTDLHGSDHFPIEVSINCKVRTPSISHKIKLSEFQ